MSVLRRIITMLLVMLAVSFQTIVLSQLHWPGATPDLVLVVVIAFAMRQQPANGALLGFFAGLLLEAAPPGNVVLGGSALALTLIGYFAGALRQDLMRSVFGPLLYVAGASAASVLVTAAFGGLMGDRTGSLAALPLEVVSTTLYTTLLATAVVPLVRILLRSLMPAPVEVLRR